jgi:hypothetical protein
MRNAPVLFQPIKKMVKVTKHAQESSLHGGAVFTKELTRDQKIKYDLDVLEQSNKKRENSIRISVGFNEVVWSFQI